MPNNTGGTNDLLKWIASNLPKNTYINLMSQYRPAFKATEFPEIARGLQVREYRNAIEAAVKAGLTNLDIQGNR
jgi:putative pyruvate formate lyase activating enzyme